MPRGFSLFRAGRALALALAFPIAIGAYLTANRLVLAETAPVRTVALTSEYRDVRLSGDLEIRQTSDLCVFRIPRLDVEQASANGQVSRRTIIAAIAVTAHGSHKFEQRLPMPIDIGEAEPKASRRWLEFRIPKETVDSAEYLEFALVGRAVMHADSHEFAQAIERLPADSRWKANTMPPYPSVEAAGVAWPITARRDLAGQPGGFQTVAWQPDEPPAEHCSAAKIR